MDGMLFKNRGEFRAWLSANALSEDGIWLTFGKSGKVETLKAGEALEEALCFGWIDGRIESVDADTYIKYFKQRAKSSKWSEKNRALAEKLEGRGLMTDFGRAKIALAKERGTWDPPKEPPMTQEQIREFEDLIKPHAAAWANFERMPRTARGAYAASYVYTKTDAGRERRLNTIIERLNLNLNPMESMKNKKDA